MSTDYHVKRPMVFLISKDGGRWRWSIWRDRVMLAMSQESHATARTARTAVERLIDLIRRNPVAPRIIEESEASTTAKP